VAGPQIVLRADVNQVDWLSSAAAISASTSSADAQRHAILVITCGHTPRPKLASHRRRRQIGAIGPRFELQAGQHQPLFPFFRPAILVMPAAGAPAPDDGCGCAGTLAITAASAARGRSRDPIRQLAVRRVAPARKQNRRNSSACGCRRSRCLRLAKSPVQLTASIVGTCSPTSTISPKSCSAR